MTRDDILRMAVECQLMTTGNRDGAYATAIERFAGLVADDGREAIAKWMMAKGYATGHGDTTEDLLNELEWQMAEKNG